MARARRLEQTLISVRRASPAVVLLVLAVTSLAACAGYEPYWHEMEGCAPIEPRGVMFVDYPGGPQFDLIGFANWKTQMVEVKKGLPPMLSDCVITHEKRHFKCYRHDPRKGFVVDCGDGRRV